MDTTVVITSIHKLKLKLNNVLAKKFFPLLKFFLVKKSLDNNDSNRIQAQEA